MFSGATNFNGQVLNWDTSNLTTFSFVFNGASAFNQDLSRWDTSSALIFVSTFKDATSFNQDLSSWDVSLGLQFDEMFQGATSFLGTGIDTWNTSSATSFNSMFNGASVFNQNLGAWDIGNLTSAVDMLTGTAISTQNWDNLLLGWGYSQQANLPNNVTLSQIPVPHSAGFPNAVYEKLTDSVASGGYGWTIVDGGSQLPPPAFEFTIDTANVEAGSSASNQYSLPLMSTGTYNFYVNWGDGTIGDQITSWNQAEATHTYATSGTYIIQILATSLSGGAPGSLNHISWASQDGTTLSAANDRLKVKNISKWGSAIIYLNEYVFTNCENLNITTASSPAFGSKVLRASAFENCNNLSGNLNGWGTIASPITGDASLFYKNGGQNPSVNFVAELTGSLFTAFNNAASFNSSLSNWDTSSVTSISRMFDGATSFNQDISTWDTSLVTNMSGTFNGATAFNQDLSSWDVRNLTNASDMFTSSGISAANWDALLIGWAAQGTGAGSLQSNVTLSDINQYHGTVNSAATAAYNKLTAAPYNWTIVDLGELTSVFEFDIDTTQTTAGSTNADQYRLPLISTGTYNFTVNWGDGNSNTITTWNQANATHTYATSGLYSISITGTIDHVSWASQNGTSFSEANDGEKLKDITDWGPAVLYLSDMVFYNCENMNITTTASPTFGSKVMRESQFNNCESFTGDISGWGTVASPITGSIEQILSQSTNGNPNLNFVFQRTSGTVYRSFFFCISYNKPLNNWDISGQTSFVQTFYACTTFNQDISGWDVSTGSSFTNMFGAAAAFNQDISSWDMSSATLLLSMFDGATSFNQDISTWDTSLVTNMSATFEGATAFNQDLSSWDVGSLTTATNMFTNSGISAENWDKLLIGWAAQGTGVGSLQANVTLSNINQLHGSVDSAAIAAYNKLVAAPYNWTIVDLGAAVVDLLLDTTYGSGAEAAYSVRKLRTAYTGPAMKVQDTVGGSTQDIYFDVNNNIDGAAIISYGGSNDVLVVTWYDQSGNSNDAEQPSSGLRPKIYDGTSGELVKENGKSALNFDGAGTSGDMLVTSQSVTIGSQRNDFSVVTYDSNSAVFNTDNVNSGRFAQNIRSRGGTLGFETNGSAVSLPPTSNLQLNIRHIAAAELNGTALSVYGSGTQNGTTLQPSQRTGSSRIAIGTQYSTQWQNPLDGRLQELITYQQNKSSFRTSIESNIGDYFTQNTPLLDTYSGAAAAYSLRLLDSTYTGFAIKVQDSVGGATQDIGFNVFGELDTVALAQYGGSNNVFVETWYDQSGNGNNATQISSTARPKIYDGATGVVLENGKPAVEFDGSNDVLFTSNTGINVGSQRNDFAVTTLFRNTFWGVFNMDNVGGGRFAQNMRGSSAAQTIGFLLSTGVSNAIGSTALTLNGQYLFSAELDGTNLNIYVDGSIDGTASQSSQKTGQSNLAIGTAGGTSNGRLQGYVQEVITYQTNQSDNRAGIEANINFFYDMY